MTERRTLHVSCPTCKKGFEWNKTARWRPFCSERCRLIDLGQWLDEDYRIAGKEQAAPFPTIDQE